MIYWKRLTDALPDTTKSIILTFHKDEWVVTVTGARGEKDTEFLKQLSLDEETPVYWDYLNMPDPESTSASL